MAAYRGRALALGVAGVLGIASPAPALAVDTSSAAPTECDVRVLAGPAGRWYGGTAMDIETVPGLGVVYYGSVDLAPMPEPEERRAYVWYGLDSQPVPVGPTGTFSDIAFELTSTGYINGQSIVDEAGHERAWVQNLRTGKLTWVDTGDVEWVSVRRINDRGEAVGTLFGEGAEPARWLRPDRAPELLPSGDLGFAEAWAITNRRDVVGSYAVEVPDGFVPQGVIWSSKGDATPLVSNAGVTADSYPRLLTEAGQAAGQAWFGSWESGHYEAARWPDPDHIEPLGLLPGGGYSGAYGQSEGGWVVGLADRFDPESPAAEWGAVDHSVLWTRDASSVRVLPSPYGLEHGLTDWREWYGGAAHAANTALDQVGSTSHVGWDEDGHPLFGPTVYVNAGACGEVVATTHTAFWEGDGSAQRRATVGQPDAYLHDAVRERLTTPAE